VDDAIGAYQRLIEITASGPVAAEAYRNLGVLYLQNGAQPEAYAALSRSVTLGVDEAAVHRALGDLAFRGGDIGNVGAALGHYERALAVEPANADLQLRRAIVLAELGRVEEAVDILEGIPAADISLPENELDAAIGELYFRLERYEDAVAAWLRVVERTPDDPDSWARLGASYRESDRAADAIAALERAIELEPEHTEALGTLASVHHQLEDWPNAVVTFERYVRLRPEDATALHSLAVAYDSLQNYPQALLNYNRFLEIDDGTNDARRFQTEQRVDSIGQILEDN
jgi:tetratricopeptide (TPR) repeat protein